MGLIQLVVVLVVLGLVWWLVENYIPMAEPFRTIARIIIVIILILILLSFVGIGPGINLTSN